MTASGSGTTVKKLLESCEISGRLVHGKHYGSRRPSALRPPPLPGFLPPLPAHGPVGTGEATGPQCRCWGQTRGSPPLYVIMGNLSASKTLAARAWAKKYKVRLCFTPTSASWANPIEAQFGPLRTFTMGGPDHPNDTVLARRLQDYLT